MAKEKPEKETTAIEKVANGEIEPLSVEIVEELLTTGNLAKLTSEQRVKYYNYMAHKAGVDPAARPFEYIAFQGGKMVLYARKGCTEQMRRKHHISVIKTDVTFNKNVIVATCTLQMPDGRTETDIGAVKVSNNPDLDLMKAVTKAKRRATLGICGLGEVEEAHPSEYIERTEINGEPKTKVLLDEQTGSINANEGAKIQEEQSGPDSDKIGTPIFICPDAFDCDCSFATEKKELKIDDNHLEQNDDGYICPECGSVLQQIRVE